MLLSEKLKGLRLKAHLPQRKVAATIDVDIATYCKFKKDVLRISREQLLKYADFQKIDANDLLADQMKKTVSEESKAVVDEAIKNCSKIN